MRVGWWCVLVFCVAVLPWPAAAVEDEVYDVVIYGGTSAGVAAAVQAARMDQSVMLIVQHRNIGGLTSSGLGRTDWGWRGTIGGVSLEFYERVRDYYRTPARWVYEDREDYHGSQFLPDDHPGMWGFEPHAAEQVFVKMLHEAGAPYLRGERLLLDPERGVERDGARISAIRMESGLRIAGRMFIDATYEGDLLAMAGVSYTVGREPNEQYGEFYNGVQKARTHNHVLMDGVDPYVEPGDPDSGLLPGVHGDDPGEDGEGDHRVQAYCFRMTLTDAPDNRVPFEQPDGYDELDYELLFRNFEAGEERIPWLPGRMPNRKTDTNNRWGVSTNQIGVNYAYPEGDYATRREIEEQQRHYQMGLMWTLANHPRVPEHVREEVSQWGLARDEFADNGHWPYQIYVREGRRMIGEYVHTELDCRRLRVAEDSVGLGSYNMDSHNVQRYVTEEGYAQNEGNLEISPGGPYVISYRALTPKREECENLLVPVAVSSSHIAFGSIRMEPVFMILGQSAATAAALANEADTMVQDVPYETLEARLRADGQYLDLPDGVGPHPPQIGHAADAFSGVVVEARADDLSGEWDSSSHVGPHVGDGYFAIHGPDNPGAEAAFEASLDPGRYTVYIAYSAHDNRAENVLVTVAHAEGEEDITVDQRTAADGPDGLFHPLGEFAFDGPARVVIHAGEADGYVIADSVRFAPVE